LRCMCRSRVHRAPWLETAAFGSFYPHLWLNMRGAADGAQSYKVAVAGAHGRDCRTMTAAHVFPGKPNALSS